MLLIIETRKFLNSQLLLGYHDVLVYYVALAPWKIELMFIGGSLLINLALCNTNVLRNLSHVHTETPNHTYQV